MSRLALLLTGYMYCIRKHGQIYIWLNCIHVQVSHIKSRQNGKMEHLAHAVMGKGEHWNREPYRN